MDMQQMPERNMSRAAHITGTGVLRTGVLLADREPSRDNNFTLLRFSAAVMVLVTHCFALVSGTGDAEPLRQLIGMTPGTIAVDIFFIISGFLVTRSWFLRNNPAAYLWARIVRIYPALVVSVCICVFAVGLYFTNLTAAQYVRSPETYFYLLKNSFILLGINTHLPGVFENVPYAGVVNGSLWTLTYELKMYLLVPLFLFLLSRLYRKRKKNVPSPRSALLGLAVFAVSINLLNQFVPVASPRFSQLLSMYSVGAACYVWRDHIRLSPAVLVLLLLFTAGSYRFEALFLALYTLTLPYAVFYLAYVPGGRIRMFNRLGDYSYGMYIYAFPVQQSVISMVPGTTVPELFCLSFVLTLLLAVLSWHCVEKHFLKLKGKHRLLEKLFGKFSSGSPA
jgi:peptidoglycan/LPS O-acetylase OafA/YrhL